MLVDHDGVVHVDELIGRLCVGLWICEDGGAGLGAEDDAEESACDG